MNTVPFDRGVWSDAMQLILVSWYVYQPFVVRSSWHVAAGDRHQHPLQPNDHENTLPHLMLARTRCTHSANDDNLYSCQAYVSAFARAPQEYRPNSRYGSPVGRRVGTDTVLLMGASEGRRDGYGWVGEREGRHVIPVVRLVGGRVGRRVGVLVGATQVSRG